MNRTITERLIFGSRPGNGTVPISNARWVWINKSWNGQRRDTFNTVQWGTIHRRRTDDVNRLIARYQFNCQIQLGLSRLFAKLINSARRKRLRVRTVRFENFQRLLQSLELNYSIRECTLIVDRWHWRVSNHECSTATTRWPYEVAIGYWFKCLCNLFTGRDELTRRYKSRESSNRPFTPKWSCHWIHSCSVGALIDFSIASDVAM